MPNRFWIAQWAVATQGTLLFGGPASSETNIGQKLVFTLLPLARFFLTLATNKVSM